MLEDGEAHDTGPWDGDLLGSQPKQRPDGALQSGGVSVVAQAAQRLIGPAICSRQRGPVKSFRHPTRTGRARDAHSTAPDMQSGNKRPVWVGVEYGMNASRGLQSGIVTVCIKQASFQSLALWDFQ